MSLTITDPVAAATLSAAVGPEVEVRGPDGRLLGRFTPAPRPPPRHDLPRVRNDGRGDRAV